MTTFEKNKASFNERSQWEVNEINMMRSKKNFYEQFPSHFFFSIQPHLKRYIKNVPICTYIYICDDLTFDVYSQPFFANEKKTLRASFTVCLPSC